MKEKKCHICGERGWCWAKVGTTIYCCACFKAAGGTNKLGH